MATARTPQDRKPARKPVQRRSTPEELGSDGAAQKLRDATRAASTRRPAAARRSSVSSADLAKEAATPTAVRPEGMPELRPLLVLHRRTRAQYLRALDRMSKNVRSNKDLRELEATEDEAEMQRQIQASPTMLTVTADIAEIAADIEDVLVLVAADPDEFSLWARKAKDDTLLAGFAWYREQADQGEA